MVLTVVLVIGLELLINHIDIDEEYTLGSSVGSFDVSYALSISCITAMTWFVYLYL